MPADGDAPGLRWKRVLLKLSGEAFAGESDALDGDVVEDIANDIVEARSLGVDIAGAFADQLVVKQSMVYQKPAGITWRQAAMVEPLSVGLHAVEITPMRLMDSVAIVGVGTIGLVTLLSARLKGAGKIIVTDDASTDRSRAILEDYGVDLVLCGHSHSYERSYLIDQAYGYNGGISTPPFATLLAVSMSARSNAAVMSRKRGPRCASFSPTRLLAPVRLS